MNSIKIRAAIKALQDQQKAHDPQDEAGLALIQGQIIQLENQLDAVLEEESAVRNAAPSTTAKAEGASFKNMTVGREVVIKNTYDPLETAAGEGAHLVGTTWADRYEKALAKGNPLRGLVRMVQTSSTHKIPYLVAGATAAITGENTAYTRGNPDLDTVQLDAYKYTITTQVSEELEADSLYNVDTLLADSFGMSFGKAEFDAIMAGAGTTEPTGILSKAANVTMAAKSTISFDDLIDMIFTVGEMYRSGSYFAMSDATLKAVAKLKDSDGNLVWTAPREGVPGMILGYPYVTSDKFEALGTSGNKVAAFFNPDAVILAPRGPLTVKKLILEYGHDYAANSRFDVKLAPLPAFAIAKCAATDPSL